jgi:hypothetical protein
VQRSGISDASSGKGIGKHVHVTQPAVLIAAVPTICLTSPDPRRRALARYSFEEAFVRLGLPQRIVDGELAEKVVVYGPVPASWRGAVLPYDDRCYDPSVRFAAVGSPPLWAPEGTEAENVDLIGGLGRLLTLTDEAQIADRSRNANGIFLTKSLPAARARVKAEPLVEHHTAALAWQLKVLWPELPNPRALWPAGRRYAVVITHDTDTVALDAPMEILFNTAKAALKRDAIRARMAWDGLTKKHNPLSAFRTWADIEAAAGLRSTFFIFGRGIVSLHLNDCRSSVFNRKVDWDLLRGLADEGWEFGYHAPIRAKENTEEFIWGRNALEARFARPVHGVRHHYWALDWRRPYLTFRKHLSAGFCYDSSITWRDAAGFRAGSCLPYRPFDPDLGRALEFYELPNAIMDGQVIADGTDVEAGVSNALRIVESVRQVGGMVVLDWHTETAMDGYCFRNHLAVLVELLTKLREDSDAWFATPWEVTQHWMERRRSLCLEAAAR